MGILSWMFPSTEGRHTLTVKHAARPRAPPSPQLEQSYFQNVEGLYIFTKRWIPKDGTKPRAFIVLLHGSGDHCRRLDALGEAMCEAGYAAVTMDHQGHGRSEGDRVHCERYSNLIDDVTLMVSLELKRNPSLAKLPRFIFGHSAGALYAIDVANKAASSNDPYRGVILCSPALYIDPGTTSPFNLLAGSILSRLLPKWPVPWVTGPDAPISRDEVAQAHYDGDPLVYRGALRPRHSMELFGALREINDMAPGFNMPYLAFHGSGDKICLLQGTQRWHEATQSADKTLVVFEGACHELLHELEETRSALLSRTQRWIEERIYEINSNVDW